MSDKRADKAEFTLVNRFYELKLNEKVKDIIKCGGAINNFRNPPPTSIPTKDSLSTSETALNNNPLSYRTNSTFIHPPS